MKEYWASEWSRAGAWRRDFWHNPTKNGERHERESRAAGHKGRPHHIRDVNIYLDATPTEIHMKSMKKKKKSALRAPHIPSTRRASARTSQTLINLRGKATNNDHNNINNNNNGNDQTVSANQHVETNIKMEPNLKVRPEYE